MVQRGRQIPHLAGTAQVNGPRGAFAEGWLDRQVRRSTDTINSLPEGVRESMGRPVGGPLTEEPKRRYTVVRDKDGDQWRRGNTRWTCTTPVGSRGVTNVGRLGWHDLNRMYGPLILVSEPASTQLRKDREVPDA